MLRSMTGFGRAARIVHGVAVEAELRSVNSRFLDLSMRLPPRWEYMEIEYGRLVRSRLSRGKVTLTLTVTGKTRGSNAALNQAQMRAYLRQARLLIPGPDGKLDPSAVMMLPGLAGGSSHDPERFRDVSLQVVERALGELLISREAEGKATLEDLDAHLHAAEETLEAIDQHTPTVARKLEERLEMSCGRLGEGADLLVADRERISKEIALLLVKGDYSEEITRLRSHISAFQERVQRKGAQGRFLEFLIQEMQRELSTLSSKSSLIEVVNLALEARSRVEKMKEQVANLE